MAYGMESHGLADTVVFGHWMDSIILEIFSNLINSVTPCD